MKITVAAACALIVIGLSAWYILSGTRHPDSARARVEPPAPLDARGAALADDIARLRRGQASAAAPQRGRDLFRFVTPTPQIKPVSIAVVAPSVPTAPPRPVLKLIGIAEDTAGGSPVRTAIISAPDQLYVVKEGDKIAARYGVTRISPDVVELVDTSDSSALRLALK